MTIGETLKKGRIKLKTNNVSEPNLKARLLLQFVLNKTRQELLVYDNQIVNLRQEVNYFKGINKLINGVPIQHITNSQEFMKMNFYVNDKVLIPRPDTEILVEEVIKLSKENKIKNVLDLCTGSGAIAVSLAKYIPNIKVTALDISKDALNVAKINAKRNNVEDKIIFVESDLFKNLKKEKYDIIVSNPPYIKKEVIKKLDEEVKKEPHIALDGGEDGLDFYRRIVNEAEEYLKFNGFLCLEIGYDQKDEVIELINREEEYINTYSKKDLFGNDRIIVTKMG